MPHTDSHSIEVVDRLVVYLHEYEVADICGCTVVRVRLQNAHRLHNRLNSVLLQHKIVALLRRWLRHI